MQDKTFLVVPEDNELRERELDVIEHVPYEPPMYQYEAGWLCQDYSGDEYFISEGGRVDKLKGTHPETDAPQWIMGWGTCPEIITRWQMLLAQEGS